MPQISRLSVIGLGLIGGSLAKALKCSGFAGEVIGYDVSSEQSRRGVELGVIDTAADSIASAVSGADLVVVAVPVRATESVLIELQLHLPGSCVVTDVGSVKGSFIKAVESVWGYVPSNFIPGHPIAGSEKSGVEAARDDLFVNHKTILTPPAGADEFAVALVTSAWKICGAEVITMGVEQHDDVLAATSHLPHLIAFSLVDTLAGEDENKEIFRYAAGGFRDFTRIASSDPVMWRDIFLSNKRAVLNVLRHFSTDLEKLKQAIEYDDSTTLMGVFTRAKVARDHFTKLLDKKSYTIMNTQEITFKALPGGKVVGDIRVPGDKSISHRSIMLGSLATGVTEVEGFLEGEDALATLQAFRDMGVVIEGPVAGKVKIHGVGMRGLKPAPGPLYLGNSGTSMRLLAGLLAAQSFSSELTGDESLSKRPMERVAAPLRLMGASIDTSEGGRPPIKINAVGSLSGLKYDMPMASAQVKSCLMLAGLYANSVTEIREPAPTRDHTERMLRGFGYPVETDAEVIRLNGGGSLVGTSIDVPSDISSAAFFLVAASIAPGADLTLRHVGVNPTRTGIVNILKLMGANIDIFNEKVVGGEPVADLRVRYSPLKGISIPQDQVPLAIDEFPVLFIAATVAEGKTILSGAEELRVKESDRIQVMADGLAALGVKTTVKPDGIEIEKQFMGGGVVDSHGDHRIAMAFTVASLIASDAITIKHCANVATSFPGFIELANSVGINVLAVTDK